MGYSWGDDTSVSKKGTGYDYNSARKAYDASRMYVGTSKASTMNIQSPLNKTVKTESPYPLVVAIDVTGSMKDWPSLFFEKLPLLHTEVLRYLPNVEISFAAIGDAHSDNYPLQVCDFKSGKDLDEMINSLYPEGGGGGQSRESYDLASYFYVKHCEIPKAKKPIFVFAGDEGLYEQVEPEYVKSLIGDDLLEPLSTMQVMKELKNKFDTYILRKTYDDRPSEEAIIHKQWKDYLGAERALMLDDPRRIVDSIIGITAALSGYFGDFSKRLSQRQTSGQVSQVMNTLDPLSESASSNAVSSKKSGSTSSKSKKLTDP